MRFRGMLLVWGLEGSCGSGVFWRGMGREELERGKVGGGGDGGAVGKGWEGMKGGDEGRGWLLGLGRGGG